MIGSVIALVLVFRQSFENRLILQCSIFRVKVERYVAVTWIRADHFGDKKPFVCGLLLNDARRKTGEGEGASNQLAF